jgi:hypothetical protein
VYQVIVRFVYMIQLLNSDQPIPLPESYLWLSMQSVSFEFQAWKDTRCHPKTTRIMHSIPAAYTT